jgi:hypothetical protein
VRYDIGYGEPSIPELMIKQIGFWWISLLAPWDMISMDLDESVQSLCEKLSRVGAAIIVKPIEYAI